MLFFVHYSECLHCLPLNLQVLESEHCYYTYFTSTWQISKPLAFMLRHVHSPVAQRKGVFFSLFKFNSLIYIYWWFIFRFEFAVPIFFSTCEKRSCCFFEGKATATEWSYPTYQLINYIQQNSAAPLDPVWLLLCPVSPSHLWQLVKKHPIRSDVTSYICLTWPHCRGVGAISPHTRHVVVKCSIPQSY